MSVLRRHIRVVPINGIKRHNHKDQISYFILL